MIRNVFSKALAAIPEGICCMVISRGEPEAGFARIASYGRMRHIGWDALRFTLEETKQLALQFARAEMSDARIERIHRKTDGWAAGLIMATEAARNGNLPEALMERLSGQGFFDYFSAEIFERLDTSVRSFLLATAFLPEVAAASKRCETTLMEAFGMEPSDQTRRIYESLHHRG